MKANSPVPINTLDKAIRMARALSRDLSCPTSKAYRRYRIFSALAASDNEGLAAFLIWWARGEAMSELTRKRP